MKKHTFAFALAVVGLVFGVAAQANAELLVGVNTQNQTFTFDSATPGTTTVPVAIIGLQTTGETVIGIDRRPTNGLVYAVTQGAGGVGRIYTLNTNTGAATFVSQISVPLLGTSFGVDFNPVPDTAGLPSLRIVSNTEQNLRIQVSTGVANVDTPLAYAAGDPNFGRNPNVVGAAYSNNFAGATTTTLRDVDTAVSPNTTNILAIQNPANDGVLTTQNVLNITNIDPNLQAYDISGLTGAPYFVFTTLGANFSVLYTANQGVLVAIGRIGSDLLSVGLVNGLAAPVGTAVPEPATMILLGTGIIGVAAKVRRKRKGNEGAEV